jgi:acetyl esterase/lipase
MTHTRAIIFLFFFILLQMSGSAQDFIPLWPEGKKPNTNGVTVTDSLFDERMHRVHTPGMYFFPVPKSENRGTTVLICPGGGYQRVSHIYNGFQVARWFNAAGVNAFVLIYRLPHQADLKVGSLAPLQDAQRAMKIIRKRFGEFNSTSSRVGIMGTSAGGHLASTVGTTLQDVSRIGDELDTVSIKPDFMILVSPVISMGPFAHAGSKRNLLGNSPSAEAVARYSNELQVTAATPPTFMVHAQNDSTVSVRNSALFFTALIEKGIPASLHVFPQGGHALKMVDNPGSADMFGTLLMAWMREKGFLPLPKK